MNAQNLQINREHCKQLITGLILEGNFINARIQLQEARDIQTMLGKHTTYIQSQEVKDFEQAILEAELTAK